MEHFNLLGSFKSYKETDKNIVPEAVFTTPHFLHHLQMSQIARISVLGKPFQPSVMLQILLIEEKPDRINRLILFKNRSTSFFLAQDGMSILIVILTFFIANNLYTITFPGTILHNVLLW